VAERSVRYYRERIAAVGQYLSDLRAPLREGYQQAPKMVEEGLTALLENTDALDRALAKSDARRAVGGEIRLAEANPATPKGRKRA